MNKTRYRYFFLLSLSVCCAAGDTLLDSKKVPSPEQQGGEYRPSELSLHENSANEKILQVPAAYWEGGCLPTAVSMVFMYWEMKGMSDLLPGNNGFQFETAENIVGIASAGYYNDYYYPEDTDDHIIPDRSESDPSTWRSNDCIADMLDTSRSRYDLSAGAADGYSPVTNIPTWTKTRNNTYTVNVRYLDGAQRGNNLWQTIVEEIDADRPLIAYVNSTKNSSELDHAITVVGYGEQNGTPYYYALNTWDYRVHRYQFGTQYERNQWGIGEVVLMDFSIQSPLAEVHKFHNKTSGAYFFSANEDEVNTVKSSNPAWTYIGTAFKVESDREFNNVPVYRFYLPQTASHCFTINEAEKEQFRQSGDPSKIQYEGIAWFGKPLGSRI